MRTYIDKLVWLISVFMMVSLFLSCGSPEEAAVEKAIEAQAAADGQKVHVDIDGEKMSVTSEDGTYKADGDSMEMTSQDGKVHMVTGDKATVPADFPKDVPVYPGAKVLMTMSDQEAGMVSLQLETADSVEKVSEYVEKELPAQGWKNDAEMKMPGDKPTHMLGFKKDTRTVMYTIQGTDSATQISVGVETSDTAQ